MLQSQCTCLDNLVTEINMAGRSCCVIWYSVTFWNAQNDRSKWGMSPQQWIWLDGLTWSHGQLSVTVTITDSLLHGLGLSGCNVNIQNQMTNFSLSISISISFMHAIGNEHAWCACCIGRNRHLHWNLICLAFSLAFNWAHLISCTLDARVDQQAHHVKQGVWWSRRSTRMQCVATWASCLELLEPCQMAWMKL